MSRPVDEHVVGEAESHDDHDGYDREGDAQPPRPRGFVHVRGEAVLKVRLWAGQLPTLLLGGALDGKHDRRFFTAAALAGIGCGENRALRHNSRMDGDEHDDEDAKEQPDGEGLSRRVTPGGGDFRSGIVSLPERPGPLLLPAQLPHVNTMRACAPCPSRQGRWPSWPGTSDEVGAGWGAVSPCSLCLRQRSSKESRSSAGAAGFVTNGWPVGGC